MHMALLDRDIFVPHQKRHTEKKAQHGGKSRKENENRRIRESQPSSQRKSP